VRVKGTSVVTVWGTVGVREHICLPSLGVGQAPPGGSVFLTFFLSFEDPTFLAFFLSFFIFEDKRMTSTPSATFFLSLL